jgi:hypothetical protein
VEVDGPTGRDVRERRPVVEEENQSGALAEVSGGRPGADEAVGLGEDLGRERRPIPGDRPRHGTLP